MGEKPEIRKAIEKETNTEDYSSVFSYLFESDEFSFTERASELIETIDELLIFDDDSGEVKGILDETYIDDDGVRQLVGNSYAQIGNLSHLRFLLNIDSKDISRLDDIEYEAGDTLLDAVYEHPTIIRFSTREAADTDEAIARRALIVKVACELLLDRRSNEGDIDRTA